MNIFKKNDSLYDWIGQMNYFCDQYFKKYRMSNIAAILEEWYETNARDLPWRTTKDPYRIWISEIILQQTRVVQGYSYFLRFLEHFPSISALANADEDEVMKCWQGLGYYSRARNLHAAAKSMNGIFPTTYEGVRALKGVGDYTAAAICSFAYNLPYAVLDGNVYRILARYYGINEPIDSTRGKKIFSQLAQELLDKSNPARYNQAIMDFGALQCVPKNPVCEICPLAEACVAFATDTITLLPVKQHKTKVSIRYLNYLYIRINDNVFLHKRVENDIWKNLYEFPMVETSQEVSADKLIQLPTFKQLFAANEQPVLHLISKGIKHVLSHQIIYATFYEVYLPEHSSSKPAECLVSKENLPNYAVSRLMYSFLEKYVL